MRRSLVLLALASFPLITLALEPVSTDGDKYSVVFENDCVRVLDYKDLPGDKTSEHRHPAHLFYAISAFKRSVTFADGRVLQREFNEGDFMWSDAQTYIGTNSGETPTHAILVEMKSAIGACSDKRMRVRPRT